MTINESVAHNKQQQGYAELLTRAFGVGKGGFFRLLNSVRGPIPPITTDNGFIAFYIGTQHITGVKLYWIPVTKSKVVWHIVQP